MANPEIQQALDDIGFAEDLTTGARDINKDIGLVAMPNPMGQRGLIEFTLNQSLHVSLYLKDLSGRTLSVVADDIYFTEGKHQVSMDNTNVTPGIYFLNFITDNNDSQIIKLIIQ